MSELADESTPLALPIRDLHNNGERAGLLEATLKRLRGVVRAYVSPFTGLAYVDYSPAQLSEDQLIASIAAAGYSIDEGQHRFAWRRH